MVILLSALAVVVAAILIAAYFVVGGGFALIYGAMALAALSMLLLWAARWIGSTREPAGRSEPEPLVATPSVGAASAPVAVGAERPASERALQATEEPEVRPLAGVATATGLVADGPDAGLPVFPLADYDTLWVSQIVPLLAELDADELAVVEARERGGRHRAAVLDAIEACRNGDPVPVPTHRPRTVEAGPVAERVAEVEVPVVEATVQPIELDDEARAAEEAQWAAWADVDPRQPRDLDFDFGDEDLPDDDLFVAGADEGSGGDLFVAGADEDPPDDGLFVAGADEGSGGDLFVAGADEDLPDDGLFVAGADEGSGGDLFVAGAEDGAGERPSDDLLMDPEPHDWTLPEEPEPVEDGQPGARGARDVRVRTFLGRRRSPVTVRRYRSGP